jgi:hypothetical protein
MWLHLQAGGLQWPSAPVSFRTLARRAGRAELGIIGATWRGGRGVPPSPATIFPSFTSSASLSCLHSPNTGCYHGPESSHTHSLPQHPCPQPATGPAPQSPLPPQANGSQMARL